MFSSDVAKKMEKVLVVSRAEASQIKKLLKENDFKIVERAPDFIVCFGGDGTVLFSERIFPGVPKLLVKTSMVCRKCDYTLNKLESILLRIRDGMYQIQKEMKLETEVKGEKLTALNEIQVHTKLPIYAIRFSLSINRRRFDNLIGDGVIVATPFGSTGYYKSTGGDWFEKGIGISFNNLHNKEIESFVVPENFIVKVRVNRGPAWVLADNNEKFIDLKDEDVVAIKKSKGVANFVYIP